MNISFLLKYIRYQLKAKTAHGIHSPFVFELYNEVICKQGSYYIFDKIERLRKGLLISKKEINVTDLGTGKSGKRTISEIAGRSLKSARYGQLLFRLAYHFKPETILELGTSLGITTAYLASANPNAKTITIEGCPEIASEAKRNFESLKINNVEIIIGNFDNVLATVASRQSPVASLVFLDGNHRKIPTLNYFSQCLEHSSNDSVFIFDDIHWSEEMEEAWEEIKNHPRVTVTVDLFFMGLVFFRKEQVKEHFVVRF